MQKEFTAQAEKVFNTAKSIAKKWKHPYVGTEHLVLSILNNNNEISEKLSKYNSIMKGDV